MTTALERRTDIAPPPEVDSEAVAIVERLVTQGDLSKLKPEERIVYYNGLCRSLGLNPMTQPFAYLNLQGKLTLYAKKDATEQLRKINRVSITKLEYEQDGDLFVVTAFAQSGGRTDMDMGAVSTKGLSGDALVNARLKAVTKAKRRVTLSICGLGFLDDSEIETIPGARPLPQVIIPAEADESLSAEQEIELLRQAVRDLCANLNAEGYQPKWTATTLKTYVNDRHMVTGGVDALSAPALRELVSDLEAKLNALKPQVSDEEAAF